VATVLFDEPGSIPNLERVESAPRLSLILGRMNPDLAPL